MKFLYLFLICQIFILKPEQVSAQEYTPFPENSSIWKISCETYFISRDSVYNSLLYSKYYSTKDSNFTISNYNYKGLVRQDVDAKKVFIIPKNHSTEKLLYNFNISIDDTLTVYNNEHEDFFKIKVIEKDSILINGNYRNRFSFAQSNGHVNYPEFWIEGIGSEYGPLSPGTSGFTFVCPSFPTLVCVSNNGNSIYKLHPNYTCKPDSCIPSSIKEFNLENSLQFYPNPTTKKAYLISKQTINTIDIINSIGEKVSSNLFEYDKKSNALIFSETLNGIYFIRITTNKEIYTQKIIIDNSAE